METVAEEDVAKPSATVNVKLSVPFQFAVGVYVTTLPLKFVVLEFNS